MTDYLTTDVELTSIANAIRTKGGTSASLTYPNGFINAIDAISAGGSDLPNPPSSQADYFLIGSSNSMSWKYTGDFGVDNLCKKELIAYSRSDNSFYIDFFDTTGFTSALSCQLTIGNPGDSPYVFFTEASGVRAPFAGDYADAEAGISGVAFYNRCYDLWIIYDSWNDRIIIKIGNQAAFFEYDSDWGYFWDGIPTTV